MNQRAFHLRLLFFFIVATSAAFGTNYYSKGGQSIPNSLASWSSTTDGTGASPTSFTAGDVFIVQFGHTMTTTANWTVSGTNAQIFINGGSLTIANSTTTPQMTISSGNVTINYSAVAVISLTVNNGNAAGEDLLVGSSGTANLYNAGRIIYGTGATGKVSNTGTYHHTLTYNEPITVFTWTAFSTCRLTGAPTTLPSGLGQTFGNLVYDCGQQSSSVAMNTAPTIASSFTIISTGLGSLVLGANISPGLDLNINGGILDLSVYSANHAVLGGTFSMGPGAKLRLSGTNNFPFNYASYLLNANSTVEYYGSNSQTVAAANYGNLTISGTRLSNSIGFSTNGPIGIAGTFSPAAIFTTGGSYLTTGSTIAFNGTGDQDLPIFSFYHLEVDKPSGTLFLIDYATVAGIFSVTNGTFDIAAPYASITANEVLIASGATLINSNSTSTLQVNDGNTVGYDLTVSGTLINYGAVTYGSLATGEIQTTGAYYHRVNGGTIPAFTWTGNARCVVDNITSAATLSGLNQVFREFIWNCPNQFSSLQFNSQLTTVEKLFSVVTTGSIGNGGSIILFNTDGARLDVGAFDQQGGIIQFNTSVEMGVDTIAVVGGTTTFSQTGGILEMTGGGIGTLLFEAVWTTIDQNGGIIGTNVGYRVMGMLELAWDVNPTGPFVVENGGTLWCKNDFLVSSSGSFFLMTGGTIIIGNINGIDDIGQIGSIQVSGPRIFSTGANYIYQGYAAQITGNGLPSSVNDLEINTPLGTTLTQSVTVDGIFRLSSGSFSIGNNILTLNSTVDSAGTGYIVSGNSGIVYYNSSADNQYVITRNSQYGNLTFSDFNKLLPSGLMKIETVFSRGTATQHVVDPNDSIDFNGTGSQTIPGFTYGNLIISGQRGESSVTFGTGDTIYIANVFDPSAIFNGGTYAADNTIIGFNGTSAQAVFSLPGAVPFHSIVVKKSLSTLTAYSNLILTGDLVLLDGILFDNANSIIVNGNILGSQGQHSSTESGRILLTGGNLQHQIDGIVLGSVELDDTLGAAAAGVVSCKDLILTKGILMSNLPLFIMAGGTISATAGELGVTNHIVFSGSGSVSGNLSFDFIEINGAVDFGTGSTVITSLWINSGGMVSVNPPTYADGSLLVYSAGGMIDRGLEWSALSGPGYPYNVEIMNFTLLNLGSYNPIVPVNLAGNLIIEAGSVLSMNEVESNMSAPLIVDGSIVNDGSIILSTQEGNSLDIQGSYFQGVAGSLTGNHRIVSFFGNGVSTIDGVDSLQALKMNKSTGDLILAGNPLSISDTLHLEGGTIITGPYAVEILNGASIKRTRGHINGFLRQYFPTGANVVRVCEIGDAISYTPVAVSFGNITAGGFLTVSTSIAGPSLAGTNLNETKMVNRYWSISNAGIAFDAYDAEFTFDLSDIDPGATPGLFTIWRNSNAVWNNVIEGVRTGTSTQGTGITGFGDFAIGELIDYVITPFAGPNGTIIPGVPTRVPHGDSIMFTFSPDMGFHVDSVLVDGVSIGSVPYYMFTNVTSDHTLAAYFSFNAITFPITANVVGNGSIAPPGISNVLSGDSLVYTIRANAFHHIDSIVTDEPFKFTGGHLYDTVRTYTFLNVQFPHTITAYFSPNPNIPPSFTAVLPDTMIARFDTLQFTYSANDPEKRFVKYSILNAPAGASIDSVSGFLTYMPPSLTHGIFTIIVMARDDSAAVYDTALVRVIAYGDITGNGTVTAFDAAKILRHVVILDTLSRFQQRIGDVSGDGSLSALDASTILQYAVGLINTFPGGLGKEMHANAVLSAFSFRIAKGKNVGEYDLIVSVNKQSNVYGLSVDLAFDSMVVRAVGISASSLTDSMTMEYHLPANHAIFAFAALRPMNTAGDIAKFTFILKDKNYSRNVPLFTMERFILNETDHTKDVGGITLNANDQTQLPAVYSLSQNFPNPFNPATTIQYGLPEPSSVRITVFDILGQELCTLLSGQQPAGYHTVEWNGTDGSAAPVASGLYFYRIEAVGSRDNRFIQVKKMVLIR